MNESNLHELIQRYSNNLEQFNSNEINEKFKWKAIGHFQEVWYSDLSERIGFAKMFAEARREMSILIDNSRKAPSTGIVKMAELRPEQVEHLFRNVLLAEDGGDISLRQKHVEAFLDGIEAVRQELFPKNWKYKQEKNDALAYLALIHPDENYLYRYVVTESFCRYIEYEMDIGMGRFFRLDLYYQLCDLIVEALRQYPDMLKRHALLLGEDYFHDESLHIMAFDLMYCSRTHELYKGLTYSSRSRSTKSKLEADRVSKTMIAEAAKAERIDFLHNQIAMLEDELAQYEEISLLGVEVNQSTYGTGYVIEQDMNKILVRFVDTDKLFTIHKSFIARPRFEDDGEIVEMYTEYGDKSKRLGELRRELNRLEK